MVQDPQAYITHCRKSSSGLRWAQLGPCSLLAAASRQEAKDTGGGCPHCKRAEGVAETTRAALRDSPLKGVIPHGMAFCPTGTPNNIWDTVS